MSLTQLPACRNGLLFDNSFNDKRFWIDMRMENGYAKSYVWGAKIKSTDLARFVVNHKTRGSRTQYALFPLICRRVTRYLHIDDVFSIRKHESAARGNPWGLHSFAAIFPPEFSDSLPAEASAQAGPFFEPPCLIPPWAGLLPGCRNTRLIRYGKAEHGADRPWVDFLPAERPTHVRPFLNEIVAPQTRHCLFPSIL